MEFNQIAAAVNVGREGRSPSQQRKPRIHAGLELSQLAPASTSVPRTSVSHGGRSIYAAYKLIE